jgi:hypothetical protein
MTYYASPINSSLPASPHGVLVLKYSSNISPSELVSGESLGYSVGKGGMTSIPKKNKWASGPKGGKA